MPQQTTLPITAEVVGFDEEAESIKDRLLGGSRKLQIINIIGMAGVGKTTLAAKVYNDRSVFYHFHACAWSLISQLVDSRRVFLELLNQVNPQSQRYAEMSVLTLAENLRKSLKRRRYLIVLDDVWDIQAWDTLGISFPDDKNGSRIILTSCQDKVAPPCMLDKYPKHLQPLNQENSLKLFQAKLFPGGNWPPALQGLGIEIAKRCKGLPLTLGIAAGLLANTDQKDWKQISDLLSAGGGSAGGGSEGEQLTKILILSCQHLPAHLKPIFLYFGTFLEDQEIPVDRLFRLWGAEGFLQELKTTKKLEDVAEEYLKDLVGRSLIMVTKQRSDGRVKSFRIHDLLLDFCFEKAREELEFNFFHQKKTPLECNEQRDLQRLRPRASSLLINCLKIPELAEDDWNFPTIFHRLKFLRVLDLEKIDLGSRFPREIDMLDQLVYLAIRGKMRRIPSSIGNLLNLETFIVVLGTEMISSPDTLWSLRKLKYLCIKSTDLSDIGGSLPLENLDNPCILWNLENCYGAIIPHWEMERLMRKFPNIRKLKCRVQLQLDAKSREKIAVIDFQSQSKLQSLDMSFHEKHIPRDFKFEISLPDKLRKLTLSHIPLSWRNTSTIGELPNLEVLNLIYVSFEKDTWDMQGEFSKIKILKICSLELVNWMAWGDQLCFLERLILDSCRSLEVMPYWLGSIDSLEMIEASDCSETVVELVKEIEREKKEDWGHDEFRIKIGQVWEDPSEEELGV